jgi:2-polyprenyl-6-methoxyphenol hydroxylase-like FAD-dependent oxidoreductase
MRETKTEVLIVGAGPVGLLTAILLAENGVETQIIDREERIASRSYACALHPRTLRLLHRLGLAEEVLTRGKRVQSIAFYDGAARCAEIKMETMGGEFPFLLVLPQSALEEVLEQRLLHKSKTKVLWNHRLDSLKRWRSGRRNHRETWWNGHRIHRAPLGSGCAKAIPYTRPIPHWSRRP